MFDSTVLEFPRRMRDVVIALHCSGASPREWLPLANALGPHYALSAPMYYGSDEVGPWPGEYEFALADEAAHINALLDSVSGKVHLVGHSYGGGVALHIAATRPDWIASLTLYEPSAFHILNLAGAEYAAARGEIAITREIIGVAIARGDYRGAAATFVDYWGGAGAWKALRPSLQQAIVRWVPKALLDFHALVEEPMPLGAYTGLDVPVLLLRGEHALLPSRVIVDTLAAQLPSASVQVIAGAGHMGPVTHCEAVATAIARHIADARFELGPPVPLVHT